MIYIHTHIQSPRLNYVLNYIFKHRLGIDFTVISDVFECKNQSDIIINYSHKIEKTNLTIPIFSQILEENYAEKFEFSQFCIKELTLNNNQINFDLFSSIFFHLSRYEEYFCKSFDQHERFEFQNSSLNENRIINFPIIDYWIKHFRNFLLEIQPQIQFKIEKFEIKPTLDIDSFYSYKNKGFLRTLKGVVKDSFTLKFNLIFERIQVLKNFKNDPFDNFDYQLKISEKFGLNFRYFILVSNFGKYDKQVAFDNKIFQILSNLLLNKHQIGLHPGYNSLNNFDQIKSEKIKLESFLNTKIDDSRQHFLRMKMPETYRFLIKSQIKNDYTMGYSNINGFRAGTSRTFYWYDLKNDTETELLIHPFSMMDVALKREFSNNLDLIVEKIKLVKKTLQDVDGCFSFVFHNESLSETNDWKNWRKIFEKCLKS